MCFNDNNLSFLSCIEDESIGHDKKFYVSKIISTQNVSLNLKFYFCKYIYVISIY